MRARALARDEIQKSPPSLARPAHQLDVAIAEINHSRDLQIIARGLLLHSIERDFFPLAAEVKLEVPLREKAIHHEPAPLVLNDVGEPRDARRLQPQQDTRGLEERRLAPGVWSHDEIQPRRKLRRERLEAAEVANFEGGKHAPVVSGSPPRPQATHAGPRARATTRKVRAPARLRSRAWRGAKASRRAGCKT